MRHRFNTLFISISISISVYVGFAQAGAAHAGVEPANSALVDTPQSKLLQKKWNHGSKDCKSNADPAIEVFQYDPSTYILRQNKCLSFEAPFIYILFGEPKEGEQKVLVLDSGATESAADFPLYDTVQALIQWQSQPGQNPDTEIVLMHSHSHGDHHQGDAQFRGKPNVRIVEPQHDAVTGFFKFPKWPEGEAIFDLGNRALQIIPTPGHQQDAVSVYDPQTKWLLTGDTVYAGLIYVKNWGDYKNSIARLADFAETHEVSVLLGAHIEMTERAGEYYSIGTVYQPYEASLALQPQTLAALNSELVRAGKPHQIELDELVVAPMNLLQKAISNVASWIFK